MTVKLMYATAPGGIQLTIPLVREGGYDTADIYQRLTDAGVKADEFPYVVFSAERPAAPSALNLAERAAPTITPPDIPEPTAPHKPLPLYSEVSAPTRVTVTKDWAQTTGSHYCMKMASGGGYVNVQNLAPPPGGGAAFFEDPVDFQRVNNVAGHKIDLCFAYVWRLAQQHFIGSGDSWDQTVKTKKGMSRTDTLSITASVGYSGDGVSASLSATYGLSITVTEETQVTTEVSVYGEKDVSKTAALWELCRKYYIEVDGEVRDDTTNNYQPIFIDKNGRHALLDTWGPTYEVVSQTPTLNTTPFKL